MTLSDLKEVFQFRGFIKSAVLSEYKTKSARSRLSLIWVFLNPLLQAGIYYAILSEMMSARLPQNQSENYAMYLLLGTSFWALFSEVINRNLNCFVENGNLIKKSKFPVLVLPLVGTCIALINSSILLAVVLLFAAAAGLLQINGILFLLPLIWIGISLLGMFTGATLGLLNVFVRDIGQVVPVLLQILFWATPIVYSDSILPETVKNILQFNPLVWPLHLVREAVMAGADQSIIAIISTCSFFILIFLIFVIVFRNARKEMSDLL